jgi:hypothetical protein
MKGRVRYAYEIAVRSDGGTWRDVVAGSSYFSRSAKATARSLVERWIHEQQGQLRGGRVIVRGRRLAAPRAFEATVRITILAGDGSGRRLAAAYIGDDRVRPGGDRYAVPDLATFAVGRLSE